MVHSVDYDLNVVPKVLLLDDGRYLVVCCLLLLLKQVFIALYKDLEAISLKWLTT